MFNNPDNPQLSKDSCPPSTAHPYEKKCGEVSALENREMSQSNSVEPQALQNVPSSTGPPCNSSNNYEREATGVKRPNQCQNAPPTTDCRVTSQSEHASASAAADINVTQVSGVESD